MAIQKSPWAAFNRTANRPQSSGAVHATDFVYDASAGLLAADKVDLGILIGNGKIVNAALFTEGNFGAVNATVGILAGDIGSTDATRALGNEIFAAQSLATADAAAIRGAKPAALLLPTTVLDRSIGLQVSADVAPTPGLKIHLLLFYTQ